MDTRAITLAAALLSVHLTGCSDEPCSGAERCACYPNDTCNDGLECRSGLCVLAPDGAVPGTAGGAAGGSPNADAGGRDAGAAPDGAAGAAPPAASGMDAGPTGAAVPDASADAAPSTSLDAALDAGHDAGNAPQDAGTDAGADASIDAGTDTGADAGADGSIDAGMDAAADAGTDAGVDAGPDVDADAGVEPACSPANPQGTCEAGLVCECGRCQPELPTRGCGLDTGYPGDETCLPPPDPSLGFQIHIGPGDYTNPAPFLVASGSEATECWVFHTPNSEAAHAWTTHLSARPGTFRSHLTLYASDRADGGWVACRDPGTGTNPDIVGVLSMASGSHAPPAPRASENDGIVTTVPATSSAELELHAFNFTAAPILRELWLNVYTTPPDQVAAQASLVRGMGGLAWATGFLGIQPNTDEVYAYECPISAAGRILQLQGHFHAHGVRLTAHIRHANSVREKVLEVRDYLDMPVFRFDSCTDNPAFSASGSGAWTGSLPVEAGDVLEWECHIINDSSSVLTYSNFVETGEMCNIFGRALGATIDCVLP